MKIHPASTAATVLASATAASYYVLNFTRVHNSIKWPLLGVHMAMAVVGFLTAIWASAIADWRLGLPSAIVCGGFIYLQFLS
jgi:hypothetical protein